MFERKALLALCQPLKSPKPLCLSDRVDSGVLEHHAEVKISGSSGRPRHRLSRLATAGGGKEARVA
jgi:hypothetical protein